MNLFRCLPALLSGFLFGSVCGLFAGDPSGPGQSVLPAAKLAAVLEARPEVQFLSFTRGGSVVIGGVAPYGSRAAESEDASRLAWESAVPANWAEWDPATGTLTRLAVAATPKDFARTFKDRLLPALPATWRAGDGKGELQQVSLRDVQTALRPKTHHPEIVAASPDGGFAAVTNYEDKDDEMGALVFLAKGKDGWKCVGDKHEAVFLSHPKFSPDGGLVVFQYQTDGYDGPEPWAIISTKSGKNLLVNSPAAPPKAPRNLLPFAIAVTPGRLAVGWSDGSVTVQNLALLEH